MCPLSLLLSALLLYAGGACDVSPEPREPVIACGEESEVASGLRETLAHCQIGARVFGDATAAAVAARESMTAALQQSITRVTAVAATLHAALDAHVAALIAQANAVHAQRVKALDAHIDQLSITAAQLRAGVAVCLRALGGVGAPAPALACGQAMACLHQPVPTPTVPTTLEIVCDCAEAETAIGRMAYLRRHPGLFEGTRPILSCLPGEVLEAFVGRLTTTWLPGCTLQLLYSGRRDGMTPAAFHEKCDNKGPTLTLIRSDNGYTFGGYSGVSWARNGLYAECASAFLFAVTSPHGYVTRFPLKQSSTSYAVYGLTSMGPAFGNVDMALRSGSLSPSVPFSPVCIVSVGRAYEDVWGKGEGTFTGHATFTPEDVEVFAVVSPP